MNPLEKLRNLLEGKTILRIENPNAAEAICKFVLSDGSSFRLHATDLGFWTEETSNIDGRYDSLHSLLTDYGDHVRSLESKINHEVMEAYEWDPPEDAFYEAPEPKIFITQTANEEVYCPGRGRIYWSLKEFF